MKVVDPAHLAALEGNLHPLLLIRAEFADGFVRRVFLGEGAVFYDGETYEGRGDIVGVDNPAYDTGGLNKQISISMSGLVTDNLSRARDQLAAGGQVRMHLLLSDPETGFQIPLFPDFVRQRIDSSSIGLGANREYTVTLSLNHGLTRNSRPKYGRINAANHKVRFPDDTFYDDLESLAGSTLQWANIAGARYN